MLYVLLNEEKFNYEINELIKLFTIKEDFQIIDNKTLADSQSFLLCCDVSLENHEFNLKLSKGTKIIEELTLKYLTGNEKITYKVFKNKLKNGVFSLLATVFDYYPPWGILTGVRPSKIVNELLDVGASFEDIRKVLNNDYSFSEEKIDLLMTVCKNERKILDNTKDNEISIYIGIPFCPSKCTYCSFTSYKANEEAINSYIEKLNLEITGVAEIINENKFEIETIYIGGGTPSTLSARQLKELITHTKNSFDLSKVKEFTVECGRPDTITKEKLEVLKELEVDRISINPQTMKEETLKLIGRNHKPREIEESYKIAKEVGFNSVNMDVIIGLPEEKPEDFKDSLEKIIGMKPENLTVHTLALKSNSKLKLDGDYDNSNKEYLVEKMLKIAEEKLDQAGYIPYYMYRQKYMAGNYENVGYCLEDKECIYNIRIIEEKQTIIALGAGGVSKAFYPDENRFERIPNVNNYEVYIDRVEEMIERKRKEFL